MTTRALVTVLPGAMFLLSACSSAGLGQAQRFAEDARDEASLPVSVKDLVDVADLIVRGTVVEVTDAGIENFPVVQPTYVPGTPAPTAVSGPKISPPTGFDMVITKVSILIDEVLFERAPVDVSVSSVITMTLAVDYGSYATPTPGDPDDESNAWGVRMTIVVPGENDERLFILTRERAAALDGYYGPFYGAYNVLDLDGDDAMLASSPPIAIEIADDPEVAKFLTELDTAIQSQ